MKKELKGKKGMKEVSTEEGEAGTGDMNVELSKSEQVRFRLIKF